MRTSESRIATRQRAEEALRLLLSEVSTISLREISYPWPGERTRTRFVAHIEVLHRSSTLVCEVRTTCLPANLRSTLDELRQATAQHSADAAPMLIAPNLSREAQAVCKECNAAFLDFEGNARLVLGETFIGKRNNSALNADGARISGGSRSARPWPAPTVYIASTIPAAIPQSRIDDVIAVGAA
ncbi:MAG: hypothetical protein ABSD70_11815 [Terracidiphilus sp.]|jgi:hypothetical protein